MKVSVVCMLCLLVMACLTAHAATKAGAGTASGWVTMPAGARSTYMGIHGGTMPVSLLVSGDGASLVTFVGLTGNDFLEVLRRTDIRMPSLLNATMAGGSAGDKSTPTGSGLVAGSATSNMPVIYLTGEGLARMAASPGQLQPFGLSDKALSIEGQVVKPSHLSPTKRYRLFFQPQYLQPR